MSNLVAAESIWETKSPDKTQTPIKLIQYVNPRGKLSHAQSTDKDRYTDVVRLRGEQECIVMCWNKNRDGENCRDIFTAEWNDGVFLRASE